MWIIFKREFYPCLLSAIIDEAKESVWFIGFMAFLAIFEIGYGVLAFTDLFFPSNQKHLYKGFFVLMLIALIAVSYRSLHVLKRARAKMEGREYVPELYARTAPKRSNPASNQSVPSGLTRIVVEHYWEDPEYRTALEAVKAQAVAPFAKLEQQRSSIEASEELEHADDERTAFRCRHPSRPEEESSSSSATIVTQAEVYRTDSDNSD